MIVFANRLEMSGPQGLVDDVSSFARRRPGAFLLAAGVAGFAVGRIARAGAAVAHDGQSNSQPRMLQSLAGQEDVLVAHPCIDPEPLEPRAKSCNVRETPQGHPRHGMIEARPTVQG